MSEDNSKVKEPPSLFSLCLQYISSNIGDVDSLIGFPQLIGLQLFEECVKREQFVDGRKSTKAKNALKIFFDAYGSQGILKSLDLRTCHLFVNDTLSDCPWLLSYIRHLDLSSCKLGDNHELLALAMNLVRLDTLNLSDNCLSDRGIWRATLPLKFHRQTNNLKNLDLSSNNVTPECLTHLAPLGSLAVVRVSHTSSFSLKVRNPKSHGRFTSHPTCPCLDARFSIVTRGWAGDVINSWKCDYSVDSSSCDISLATSSKPTSSLSATAIQHKVKSFCKKLLLTLRAIWSIAKNCATQNMPYLFLCYLAHRPQNVMPIPLSS